jgi:hypothetical protein
MMGAATEVNFAPDGERRVNVYPWNTHYGLCAP